MSGLDAGLDKMRAEGARDAAVETLPPLLRAAGGRGDRHARRGRHRARRRAARRSTTCPEADGRDVLDRAVVLKLNGGLGTSMGMTGAKSLLEVKDGLHASSTSSSRRCSSCAERSGARLPLVLMNSLRHARRLAGGARAHPELASDVPADFVQNKVPKLAADDLAPVEWPADPGLEWAPPGHGDLYTALRHLGDARRAARPRLPLRLRLQRPTTSARCSSRGSSPGSRARGAPFAHGGRRPHGGRPQGRPPGAAPGRRPGAARDRADARRRRRRLPGHDAPPLLQHEHPVGRPAGAAPTCSTRATASSGCR